MTIEVESMLSPEGEPSVGLTVSDQVQRWFKRLPTTVYLSRPEARTLAKEILSASGIQYATVLEEEAQQLRKALQDPDLGREQVAHLQTCQAIVKLLHRVLSP